MNGESLRALIREELPELVSIRRDLHRHPELGYQETRTGALVAAELSRLGIEHKRGMAKTGVLGHLPATGESSRGAIALRADLDALPIHEASGKDYASGTPGIMHACGHDGHTTILLGAARVLSKVDRPRPVTLVFQPAEEGGAGGDRMCQDGALLGGAGGGIGPPVEMIYGLHGWPQIELGTVATRPGPLLAATDDFVVTVRGTQCHAAYPHLGHDPIVAAAHVVAALQTIVSRSVSPVESCVVTVGEIRGGSANNVIPAEVRMTGTVRTLTPEVRQLAREAFFRVVEQTAAAHGCRAKIDWEDGYPVTHNDPGATERFFAIAREAIGAKHVHVTPTATMGGEDFSYYGLHVPACFFFLGVRPPGGTCPSLHQPDFDFNDDAIGLGVELMCRLALAEG